MEYLLYIKLYIEIDNYYEYYIYVGAIVWFVCGFGCCVCMWVTWEDYWPIIPFILVCMKKKVLL